MFEVIAHKTINIATTRKLHRRNVLSVCWELFSLRSLLKRVEYLWRMYFVES